MNVRSSISPSSVQYFTFDKRLLFGLLLLSVLAFCAPAARADVTVSAPANGATVTSPFLLQAQASSCQTQPTASMAYSFDDQADNTFSGQTSLNTQVSTNTGARILRVKAWGNSGALCETDLSLTVVQGVAIITPSNGATVKSPFNLQEQASSCQGQPTASIAYSLDDQADQIFSGQTSITTSVSTTPGAHLLRGKAWGNSGSFCETDVNITVAAGDITVTTPTSGASVSSPFTLQAQSTSCLGQPTASMAYSIDQQSDHIFSGQTSLNTQVTMDTLSHVLHVKAWGNSGAFCKVDLDLTASGPQPTPTPPGTVTVSNLDDMTWSGEQDSAGSTGISGNTSLVTSPARDQNSRIFQISTTTAYADWRFWITLADKDTTSTNFQYDVWVYVDSSISQAQNLEMDMNQALSNGNLVIYGLQCAFKGSLTWEYASETTDANGVPNASTWVSSNVPCHVADWTVNTWHHVTMAYHRNSAGVVTYDSVTLDGNLHNFVNATSVGALPLNWTPGTLLPQFQIDGGPTAVATITMYADQFTITRW